MTEQQKKRRDWVSRKFHAANKYLSDRLKANEEGLTMYAEKAQRIRSANIPNTLWFAEFIEETCLKDLAAEHVALQEQQANLNEKHLELCWMMAEDESLSAVSG